MTRIALAVPGLLLLVGTATAQRHQPLGKPGTLKAELAAARREGLPTSPKDLVRPKVRPDRNAARAWRDLSALLGRKPLSEADSQLMESRMLAPAPSPEDVRRVKAFLARRKDLMPLIYRATSLADCDFERDWAKGPALVMPEFRAMRAAARLLRAEAAVHVSDRRPLDAVKALGRIFRIGDHASVDSLMIGHLVDRAVRGMAFVGLDIVLRSCPEASVCRAVQRAVAASPQLAPLTVAGTEVVSGLVCVDIVRDQGMGGLRGLMGSGESPTASGGKLPDAVVDANAAYLVWFYRGVARAFRMPYPQQVSLLSRLLADLEARGRGPDISVAVATIVVPAIPQFSTKLTETAARSQVIRAAAHVLGWRAEHGRLPTQLSECMPSAPTDPFDLKPLRYRREGSGFVVYSVGRTGKYSGVRLSDTQPKTEAVFRWP
jgi:hypothetical protein